MKLNKIDFDTFEKRKRAAFINCLSGFKSANLIGTISKSGQTNLSIVSSAFHLGADPSLLGLIIRPDVSPRHTLDNIRENKFCTLNHVNEEIWKQAHQTSARYEREQSEFKECGLTEEYRNETKQPYVKESKLQILLKLIREVNIEENNTHLLILEIKEVYTDESNIDDSGFLDIEKLGTISVSGLDSYHRPSRLARLSYAKPNKQVEEI